jgi:hypothetical protein
VSPHDDPPIAGAASWGFSASASMAGNPRDNKPQPLQLATATASFSFFNIFCAAPLIQTGTSNNIHGCL